MAPTTDHNFRYPALTDTPNVPRDIQALAVDIAAYVDVHPGPQGIQGIQGLQGTQGVQGLQGRQGTQGIQGVQGMQGTQGVQGTQGLQGIQGTQGIQGVQGMQGTQGVQGTQGLQGIQGLLGTQGIQGVQGIQGIMGQAGSQNAHGAVKTATVIDFVNATYTAGTADGENGTGVGAKITSNVFGTASTDGYTWLLNDRVLVKNRSNAIENGIYKVTTLGTTSVYWVLTRATDYDNSNVGEVTNGDYVFVLNGTTYANTTWVQYGNGSNSDGSIRIGTDSINFTIAAGTGAQGIQGSQGIQGTQSLQGTQGIQGLQGLQGGGFNQSQGVQGIQGTQGVQGTQGLQGSQGTQGVQGTQGLQGVQGIQGLGLPTQTGNAGKYLYTDGSATSWVTAQAKFTVNTTAKTAAYTLATTDYESMIQMNGAFAFNVTTALSTAPAGTQINLLALTTGVSVTATGVTLNATPGLKLRTAYSSATLICLGTNNWLLVGDLSA